MRQAGYLITFDDARYMVDNEGFVSKKTIPSSKKIMTKEDINEYLYAKPSPMSSYGNKFAVPYDKIQPENVYAWRPINEYCIQIDETVLEVTPVEIYAGVGQSTHTVNVTSNRNWIVIETEQMLTTSTIGGSGNQSFTITVFADPETGTVARSGIVTVKTTGPYSKEIDIVVVQEPNTPTLYRYETYYHPSSLVEAARKYRNNESPLIVYTDNRRYRSSTEVYLDTNFTKAPAGIYARKQDWLYFNGDVVTDDGWEDLLWTDAFPWS